MHNSTWSCEAAAVVVFEESVLFGMILFSLLIPRSITILIVFSFAGKTAQTRSNFRCLFFTSGAAENPEFRCLRKGGGGKL